MTGFTEISPSQLMRLLGTPKAPTVLDVRLAEDIKEAPRQVPTSRHIPHSDVTAHLGTLTDPVVVVCQRGKKLSHGVTALLRSHGFKADVLSGGAMGWHDAGFPMIPLARRPRAALWVTRHRPKIDRIACPWLIRRFIDPDARVLFVPPAEVQDVATRFDATALDAPSAHYRDQGERCSFDAILDAFQLWTEPLDAMARVVRAADRGDLAAVPEAAGLLAFSVGMSRMFRDDQAQLGAALPVYDALYRWARDGRSETHDHEDA